MNRTPPFDDSIAFHLIVEIPQDNHVLNIKRWLSHFSFSHDRLNCPLFIIFFQTRGAVKAVIQVRKLSRHSTNLLAVRYNAEGKRCHNTKRKTSTIKKRKSIERWMPKKWYNTKKKLCCNTSRKIRYKVEEVF